MPDGSGIYKIWEGTNIIKIKDVVFNKRQVLIKRPANLLYYCNNILSLQEPENELLEPEL